MPANPCMDLEKSPLESLAEFLGCHWENIERARNHTKQVLLKLEQLIAETAIPRSDASIVVHGSLARGECTRGSDLDWTLLVDAQASADHQESLLRIRRALSRIDCQTGKSVISDLGLKDPGQENTFGGLTFSQPMVHFIGGEDDSNSNTTHRILLLLESASVGINRDAFERVRKAILRRYFIEDVGLLKKRKYGNSRCVPLFLLNDFARYWRTMAVDFAYKQFNRGKEGYALRSIKLGTSRKMLFASGLLACFWCDPKISKVEATSDVASVQELIDRLDLFLAYTPLERIAQYYLVYLQSETLDSMKKNARNLFGLYDRFLGFLDDGDKRMELQGLTQDKLDSSHAFAEATEIRRDFGREIVEMFMGNDSPLKGHSMEKGVF